MNTYQCIHCGWWSAAKPGTTRFMFCSLKCKALHQFATNIIRWKLGILDGWTGKTVCLRKWLRRYILASRGTACVKCGWNERHPIDGKTLTEINHIDGNAKNCAEENLEVICPNCHSMTHNFRARNKNSSRLR